jgi:tetratricopeptide (TPR) repeat protein
LQQLNRNAPIDLERIVNKCLEKDRKLRYQHASDISTDLQRLKRDTESARVPGASAVTPRSLGTVWKVGIPVAVTAALIAAAGYRYLHRTPKLTDRDTIVLADFDNKTGDPVFDDTLKTALSVSLNQSPFLNGLSDNKVAQTLKLMTRPPDTKLTPDVARELCQRAGSKAYVAGSIASLGSQYVLGLKAVNCQSGDTLAQEQATATAKEKVLNALGEAASKLRGELGESLATVRKFDIPLEQATTSSLDALKALTLASSVHRDKGISASLAYYQRAIQLDPNFARAYFDIGARYFELNEPERGREYYSKAFALRERAGEEEKLSITANYYLSVSGELEKAAQALQELVTIYPRGAENHHDLGNVYVSLGQYDKGIEEFREAIRIAPDYAGAYGNMAQGLLALQRVEEARQTIHQALKLEDDYLNHAALYGVAFVGGETSVLAEQQKWFAGRPEENEGLSLASDTEAYLGHLHEARELTRQSVESATRVDSNEGGAIWLENSAVREAAFSNASEAKHAAEDGLKLAPASPAATAEAALAYAMAGDVARSDSLAQDLNKHYPLDTQIQSLWLPAIHAQVALNRNDPARAVNTLQVASAVELGQIFFLNNLSCLYPTYTRGQAYLAAGQGPQAATEFQKILDHSGIVWNCWTGALARLGVARANAASRYCCGCLRSRRGCETWE